MALHIKSLCIAKKNFLSQNSCTRVEQCYDSLRNWITKKSVSIRWNTKGQKQRMDGRLPLTHSCALFKMRNKLFGLLPVLQPASKGGVLPLVPTPFPPPPWLSLCHSEAYTDGFCTYLLLVKCLFMTYWGSCLVLWSFILKKKKRVGYWYSLI